METITEKKEVKARLFHFCDFCDGRIKYGEKYFYAVYKHDGQIYSWKTHKDCDFISGELNMYEQDQGDGLTADIFQSIVCETHKELLTNNYLHNQVIFDLVGQLSKVPLKYKLEFVVKHFKKKDK